MRKDPVSKDQKQPDDLLSAYFDGEATPEESAAAERRMYESDEARREHHEIGELSRLLQSLPRDTPPQELAPSVLQRAERETLLASDKHSSPASAARRSRMVIGGSLFATAAALLAMVWLIDGPAERGHRATETVDAVAPENTIRREILALDDVGETTADADVSRASVRDEAESLENRLVRSESVTGMHPAASDSAPPSIVPSEPSPGSDPGDALEFADAGVPENFDLNKARIGDVIPYLEKSHDRVSVIKVTVVDVERAVGVLRVILAKYSVPQSSDLPAGQEGDEDSDLLDFKNQDDGLLAIYAEAPGEHLANAVDHFRQQYQDEKKTVSLAMEPALDLSRVEVAAVDPVAIKTRAGARFGGGANMAKQTLAEAVQLRVGQNKPLGLDGKERTDKTIGDVAASTKRKVESKPTDNEPKTKGVSADEALAKKTPITAPSGSIDSEKVAPKAAERDQGVAAFQMLFNLDSKTLASPPQQKRTRSIRRKSRALPSPSRAAAVAKAAVPQTPVRVIFVFHKTSRGPAGS